MYGVEKDVRTLTGLTSSDISDQTIIEAIEIADDQIDAKVNVSLSGTQKKLASNYLASILVLENLMGKESTKSLKYSISGISIDKASKKDFWDGMIQRNRERFEKLLSEAGSGATIESFW